jgi:CheY-like chemotaxis protein
MPDGGRITLRTRNVEAGGTLALKDQGVAPGDYVQIEVADSGAGMPPEVLERCREPFFTTKARAKGTGLGLPMVQSTMQAHDGRLELQSTPGKGTQAVLVFPVSRLAVPLAAGSPVEATAPTGTLRLRVLLVDDDDLVRESVTELLGLLGHQAVPCACGEEALALMEKGLIVDLVILDMNMPGLSGAQVLPRLLALHPGLPVILATGYIQEDLTPLLSGRPNVRALSKPFSVNELRSMIAQFGLRYGDAYS